MSRRQLVNRKMKLPQLLLTATSLFSPFPRTALTSINCLTSSTSTTLEALITCFDAYTVSQNYYDQSKYDAAQPDSTEKTAWTDAITALLAVNNNCTSTTLPSELNGIYTVSLFTESVSGGESFCVLSESNSRAGGYARGWGLAVVPATRAAVSRFIHISAPHPLFDSNTPKQAAALFKATGARSLLISGRFRRSFLANTTCVIPTPGNGPYYVTDPAHDNHEPFHYAITTIRDWQNAQGGCPSATCAYLQMHGKSPTTCTPDNIFLSSGLTGSAFSGVWYTDSTDRPIKRLKTQLIAAFPSSTISFPTDDTSCGLTATKNIFGRLVNGVADICTKSATRDHVTGEFVHAEQDSMARDDASFAGWVTALKATFTPVCMSRMTVDSETGLCVYF